jgi:hypothetical protein
MTQVKHGATDQSFYFKLVDSAAGTPETGLTIANIDATYVRTRAAAVKNDLTALGSVNAAHADNQAIEVDATNAPGLYRVDFPDAAFASGADKVILSITCAGCDPAMKEIELVANTAEDVFARLGAPAGASHAADVAAIKAETALIVADTNELQTDWANGGRLDSILDARASQTSVDDLPTNAELATALAAADDAVLAEVALVKAKTDNLPSDPADASTVAAATDAILTAVGDVPTVAEFNARTLAAADYATAAALATVDTNVDDLTSGIIFGAAATGTLSTTQATTDLTGYADDQLIGRVIIWLGGACEGEATRITDYASSSGLLTFTALAATPSNGDPFKIV